MPTLNESTHAGEFLLSEGNGEISREVVTIVSGQNLAAGAVLGKITASGKYTAYSDAAVDGSETAVAVLYDAVDASGGDQAATAIVRQAEVDANGLVWGDGVDQVGGTTDLAAVDIHVR